MELNTINKTGTWSETADRINSNFSKISIEVEEIKQNGGGGSGGGEPGGGEGGLIKAVYGFADLGKTFDDSNLSNTFNAYTINEIWKLAKEGGMNTDKLWQELGKDDPTKKIHISHLPDNKFVTLDTEQTVTASKIFTGQLSTANVVPSVNNASTLGLESKRWENIYAVDANISGTVKTQALQVGDIKIIYDSVNKAVTFEHADGNTEIGFYTRGWISALGVSPGGSSIAFYNGGGTFRGQFGMNATNWFTFDTGTATANQNVVEISPAGGIHSKAEITAKASGSDIRLKKDIQNYNAMDIINKFRSVKYHWNDVAKANSEVYNNDYDQFGLIAQDLIAGGFEQWVRDVFHDYYTVTYERLIPVVWKGLQEVDDEVTRLKKRVRELENRLGIYNQ